MNDDQQHKADERPGAAGDDLEKRTNTIEQGDQIDRFLSFLARPFKRFRNPNRRWYQFSLRTLLIAMLVLGLALGWLGDKVHRARVHREAVLAIEAAGGYVGYEYRTLRIGDVVYAGLSRSSGDAELEYLKGLTTLRRLDLGDTKVTDAGMEHLKGLTNLEWLNIVHTPVTDAGLEHIKGLTKLRSVLICGPTISRKAEKELMEALPNYGT